MEVVTLRTSKKLIDSPSDKANKESFSEVEKERISSLTWKKVAMIVILAELNDVCMYVLRNMIQQMDTL